jgi:hypothetical protein
VATLSARTKETRTRVPIPALGVVAGAVEVAVAFGDLVAVGCWRLPRAFPMSDKLMAESTQIVRIMG